MVAHSQGNLFGRKALISLTQNPKDFWMGNYFEAVSVASSMLADIKDDTPRIDWDNDIVSAIALGIADGSVENPVRYLKWSLVRPDIGIAWLEKIPSAHAWKSQIGGLTPKGHWKSNNSFGFSSVVHAFTFYMGESLAEKNYFDGSEMNSTKAKDKILAAISTKLNNGKSCPCSNSTSNEPIEMTDGAIDIRLSWTCANHINMDLTMTGPRDIVKQDVKDVENLGLEHAYVESAYQIHPGDLFTLNAKGNQLEESELEERYLATEPIDIYAVLRTPTGMYFEQYEAKNFKQLDIGDFAEIEVKDKIEYTRACKALEDPPEPNWYNEWNKVNEDRLLKKLSQTSYHIMYICNINTLGVLYYYS